MKFKKYLKESGLTRVWKHSKLHDIGIITASRFARECGKGEKYTNDDNKKRNKLLLAKLQSKEYGVTTVKGTWIENYESDDKIEVNEKAFLVVDLKDRNDLEKMLIKFGIEFDQDSILFIPRGNTGGRLIGTNKCPNSYPGWKKIKKLKNAIFGEKGEFFTRVNGRPFILKEDFEDEINPMGFFGKWGCSLTAKEKWEDIEI